MIARAIGHGASVQALRERRACQERVDAQQAALLVQRLRPELHQRAPTGQAASLDRGYFTDDYLNRNRSSPVPTALHRGLEGQADGGRQHRPVREVCWQQQDWRSHIYARLTPSAI